MTVRYTLPVHEDEEDEPITWSYAVTIGLMTFLVLCYLTVAVLSLSWAVSLPETPRG